MKCGCDAIVAPQDRTIIYTQPTSVYINEGPSFGLFESLIPNLRVLAFTGPLQFIFSPRIRDRITSNKTTAVTSPNLLEISYAPNLALSLIGTFSVGSYVGANTGKPFLVIGEVSERALLGRAEYIKLLGLLFGLESRANREFSVVEMKYISLPDLAQTTTAKPSVFYNYPFGDSWSQPGQFQYTVAAVLDTQGSCRFSNDGRLLARSLSFGEILRIFKMPIFLSTLRYSRFQIMPRFSNSLIVVQMNRFKAPWLL